MAIAEVVKYEGPHDTFVWKYPLEYFNTASKLIVDQMFEALLVVNGTDADLFAPGERDLSISNIPIAAGLTEIPEDGRTPFRCKAFFINRTHPMNLRWGLINQFVLEDPIYNILLHVSANGIIILSVKDSRKFVMKCVGTGDQFRSQELTSQPTGKFISQIAMVVQDCLSKIMIKGKISYFVITQELASLSGIIKDKLQPFFDDYGLNVEFFNINAVNVPDSDYAKVNEAKDRSASRFIEGYTWQEERKAKIMETFAGNPGAAAYGNDPGDMSAGRLLGDSFAEIARTVLAPELVSENKPPEEFEGRAHVSDPNGDKNINNLVTGGLKGIKKEYTPPPADASDQTAVRCPACGASLPARAKFCFECGSSLQKKCPACGTELPPGARFCMECGMKL